MHITKKDITDRYRTIISVDYCKVDDLMRYHDRIGYTSGKYGWNADVFAIDNNTAIVTGYRPFGTIKPNPDTVERYNDQAKLIWQNMDYTYESIKPLLDDVLAAFVREILV